MSQIEDIQIDSDQAIGEGGFLVIRRMKLRNVRKGGSLSEPYSCDFAVRPRGIDAVVVAIYSRTDGAIRVLVRDGLRPPLRFGRDAGPKPVADAGRYLLFREAVAGIIEAGDDGEAGIRARAAAEVHEEAGYRVSADDVVLLGAGFFPLPGTMAEKVWVTAVEIADPAAQEPLSGDGSAMEEGAITHWIDLDEAITACVSGDIEDAKTEIALRRLRDRLAA